MSRMGFSNKWIKMIMLCVTMVTYSFKLNEDSVGYVHLESEIRQGDPLLPYLFIICAKGLSALLIKAKTKGWCRELKYVVMP